MNNPSYNSDGVSPLVVCSIHGAANVMLRVQGKRERFSQRRIYKAEGLNLLGFERKRLRSPHIKAVL